MLILESLFRIFDMNATLSSPSRKEVFFTRTTRVRVTKYKNYKLVSLTWAVICFASAKFISDSVAIFILIKLSENYLSYVIDICPSINISLIASSDVFVR